MSPDNRNSEHKASMDNRAKLSNRAENNSDTLNGVSPTVNYVSGDAARSSSSHQFHKNSKEQK